MSRPSVPSSTWFDTRIRLRPSAIHGRGLFTTDTIPEGEAVMIWGGIVYSSEELRSGAVPPGQWSYDQIDEDMFLFAPGDGLDYFLNHSCDPNLWLPDEVMVVARRTIQAGEELTVDYALLKTRDSYRLEPCGCGSQLCRGTVTGSDWMLADLQERYQDHFMPYINRRIARQRGQ